MDVEDYAKKLTDKELIKEYKIIDSMINQSQCYGVNDLILAGFLGKELENRGFLIEENYKKPIITKEMV